MEIIKLSLIPIKDSDIKRLKGWLHKDYIQKWYNDADEWINEIKERNNTFKFLKHYIVLEKDMPLGFCQYYDCFDAKEDWYIVEIPDKVYSIDYLIGEEEFLGRGYGKKIVKTLVEKIIEAILVQPDKENIPSCKALLANGFIFDTEKNYYILRF